MSFEPDPRRGPRPVLQRRRRGALAPTLAILGVLIVLGLILAQVWTDVLWYNQLDLLAVYRTQLLTKALLFIIGGALMAAGVLASMVIGYRSRPVYAPQSTEQASLDRYRDTIEPLRRLVVIAVPAGLALFAGSAASQEWQTVLLWWNGQSFGVKDPQFGLDIGFFVFTLPWLQFLTSFLTAIVFLAALAAVVTHYLYGGLRLQGTSPRLTSAARVHLASLAAAFLLLRGIDYWLGRYELAVSQSSLITGLTYTDAHATLTAKAVLSGIALIVAALFVVAAVVERWRLLPLYGVVLLVVSAILIGGIYPALVQRFQVTPSASSLEAPYIARNISATRAAFGLSTLKTTPYAAKTTLTTAALAKDAANVPGIRLLDPTIVSPTFRQLQQTKPYYTFPDTLSVDRYPINGTEQDTVIAVRELNLDGTASGARNWYNDHISYTHGFGVVAAYGTQRSPDGKPVFLESGIPPTGALGSFEPRVYFGEDSPDYSIVGGSTSAPRELDYPDDSSATGQRNTSYTGKGGVAIGSLFNRLLYALKFREQNILLSDAVTSQSRILYDRNPRDRVQKAAPFLTLDGNPYPAVVDGRIDWIIDGYTTSDQYPYSQLQSLANATADSVTESKTSVVPLADTQVNYIRNSVKATVDAYDGTVTLYAWDDTDPLLKAWMKIFPGLIKPMSAMSASLMSHMRYPEDLFKVQRDLITRYHVQDPPSFFGQQDFWQVPEDPNDSAASQPVQPPYYLTLQMPDQTAPVFSLTSTFIPRGNLGNQVLTGFLAVDSDAGDQAGVRRPGYGQLRLLTLPRDSGVPGPSQVEQVFTTNTTIGDQLNVLRLGNTTTVVKGNLLTLPVGDGLLYVQPVYILGSSSNAYPLLQKVLVSFGTNIGFADTLAGALAQVFNGTGPSSTGTSPPASTATTPPSTTATTGPTSTSSASAALDRALKQLAQDELDSNTALSNHDFAAYGKAQTQLDQAIAAATQAYAQLQAAGARTGSPATTPAGTGGSTG